MEPSYGVQRGATYRPRFVDAELSSRLATVGAVLVEGPRACGKTATARHAARSEVLLDTDDQARAAGLIAPSVLLDGETPRLLDEWQLVPALWNHVRRDVDDHPGDPGRFILTGSAVPDDDITRHSGALRISRLRLRPMSLAESGHSTGAVSLGGLFSGEEPRAADPGLTITDVAERIVVGGWPKLLESTPEEARRALRDYLDNTRRIDLYRLDGVRRDPENVERVVRSLARNIATPVSTGSIAADVGGPEGPIKPHTVKEYLEALTRVFVLEDVPAWAPALRSRSLLRTKPVRHFVDPSLATAALNASPDRLIRDVEALGLLFESLVVRDLRIYSQVIDGSVYHYRDNTGLEADAIVELADGSWAAFEVKLGQAAIEAAAENLLRLVERVDILRHGKPAVLGVITGWGYAYRRPDGVAVIPIATLAP